VSRQAVIKTLVRQALDQLAEGHQILDLVAGGEPGWSLTHRASYGPAEGELRGGIGCPLATEIHSASVRHRGHFSELAGVDRQSSAMMRGVLDHGPYDFADGLAAHHRAFREWPREILRAARAEELDRVCICGFKHLARGGEGGHSIQRLDMFLEIEIEAFRPGCALDKPVESLSHVCHLLRNGHHAFLRPKPGVGLIEHSR
jgi:hypothetical protein